MEIVRKYLTPDEISSPNTRIVSPDATAEMTVDGENWTEDPAIDPRHGAGFRRPPLTGDVRCDAAARMVAQWKETLDLFVLTTDAASAVQLLLTLVVALTGPVGVLVWVVWAIVNALIFIGRENIVSAFTPEVWDGIQCIIYCAIDGNGQMSSEQNTDIMAQIAAAYPGVVYNTLVQLNYWYGEVLLSNAGVVRSETGDCDECDCCTPELDGAFDWKVSNYGWGSSPLGSGTQIGTFVNGQGLVGANLGSYYESEAWSPAGVPCAIHTISIRYNSTGDGTLYVYLETAPNTYTVVLEVGTGASPGGNTRTFNDLTINLGATASIVIAMTCLASCTIEQVWIDVTPEG